MTPESRKYVEEALQEGFNRHIPLYMQDGLRRYILDGVPPGGFLTAVLSNDLLESCAQADLWNAQNIREYVQFLYCYAPTGCWKSPEAVTAWIKHRGLEGMDEDCTDDDTL